MQQSRPFIALLIVLTIVFGCEPTGVTPVQPVNGTEEGQGTDDRSHDNDEDEDRSHDNDEDDPEPEPEPEPEPGQTVRLPDWFEVPAASVKQEGDYLVDATDGDLYYAYHLCAGNEKGPGGRTARNYTVCFSAGHHCPLWVAAPRHKMYEGSAKRTDSYRQDPDIPSDIQYRSKDTGGGWNTLEDWVDNQFGSDTLYVVIGCYFDTYTDAYGYTASPRTISFGGRTDDVDVPTMFYYVLLRAKSDRPGKSVRDCSASELKCAAFVRSHTNSLKGQKVTAKEMMSIEALERITGITYFPNVPNAPKSTADASDWHFSN